MGEIECLVSEDIRYRAFYVIGGGCEGMLDKNLSPVVPSYGYKIFLQHANERSSWGYFFEMKDNRKMLVLDKFNRVRIY